MKRSASLSDAGAVFGVCWRFWRREPKALATVCGLMLAITAADVAAPLAIGALVDAVARLGSDSAALDQAQTFVQIAAAAFVIQAGLKYGLDRVWNGVSARTMQAIQLETFAQVQRFSADWHANTFAGATVHKISRGRWALDAIGTILVRLVPLGMLVLALGITLTARLPVAGIAFFAICVAFVGASWWVAARWVRPIGLEASERDARLTGAVADSIGNNAAVKSFGAEAAEDDRVRAVSEAWREVALRSFHRSTDMSGLQQLVWAGLQTVVLFALVAAAKSGAATPGDIAFAVAANLQLGGHLRSVGQDIRMMQRAFGEIADAVGFLNRAPEVADPPKPARFAAFKGSIAFERVTFAYPGQAAIYRDFSLNIAAGERVGLVGATGAGKSTFVKLIQRLYDVQGGAIRIDGTDIASVRQADLRRAIAVVPQEPALFHRSLAENIAYGRPKASMAEIVAAAKRARAHEFISRLPQGYETLVGERGVKLSGGERQRVALARAFLADAPILILDEATSSLDVRTEQEIQASTEELMATRTTLVIAHRLSTVRRVDRILVFEGGRIVEQGAPAQLLSVDAGRFRALHELQAEAAA